MDQLIQFIASNIDVGKVLTYGYLVSIVVFFILLWKISRDQQEKFTWIGLISNPDGTASLTRFLQLAAGITGTWVIINLSIKNTITVDMFGVYLAAMGISEGWTKWVQSKKE